MEEKIDIYKREHSLHSLKLKGKQTPAYYDIAQQCPTKFAEILAVNTYSPVQGGYRIMRFEQKTIGI